VFGTGSSKDYNKLKDAYIRYVKTYRLLNGGSSKGVTPFQVFYTYQTFVTKYSDPRSFMLFGYV